MPKHNRTSNRHQQLKCCCQKGLQRILLLQYTPHAVSSCSPSIPTSVGALDSQPKLTRQSLQAALKVATQTEGGYLLKLLIVSAIGKSNPGAWLLFVSRRLGKVMLVFFYCRSCSCKVWQFGYKHPVPALWHNSFEHHYHPMSGVQRNIAQTEGLRIIPVGSTRSTTCSVFSRSMPGESGLSLGYSLDLIFLSNRALTILTNFAHVQYRICNASVRRQSPRMAIQSELKMQQASIQCHSVGTVFLVK